MLTVAMAKAHLVARFAVEAAPSQLSSIIRRRRGVPRMLDTIAEDEKEAAVELSSCKPPLRNVIVYARETGGYAGTGDKRRVGNSPADAAHGEKRLVLASAPPAKAG